MRDYNWAFADGYPPCNLVQQAAVFMLYVLRERASAPYPTESYAEIFIKAFPSVIDRIPAETFLPPEKSLANIIRVRLLDRFASFFGLVELIEDLNIPYLDRDTHSKVRTTKLFDEVFLWFSNENI